MKNIEREQINKVIGDVFMQFPFMFAEPIERDEIEEVVGPIYRAIMVFHGDFSGKIEILLPKEVGVELTKNLLSDEFDEQVVPEHEVVDSIKELANVICGHFITTLFGEERIFNVDPPIVSNVTQKEWLDSLVSDDAFYFLVDDTPMFLEFKHCNEGV